MEEMFCGEVGGSGPGELRDRVFIITRLNGELVSARTFPAMVKIMPKIQGKILTVSAQGATDLRIDIDPLYSSEKKIKVKVWKDEVSCVDCGDEAARWFSKAILGENEGLRFAFYSSHEVKPVIQDRKYIFDQAPDMDTGTLHDETSYLLMNQGSFDDLNKKLDKPVVPLQYRPNFVVEGPAAWEEDNWKWIKIGNQTIFKNVQPCIRCIFTNIDPSTGERMPNMEPLKTLRTFRYFENIAKNGPYFGIHLGIRTEGKVKVGDDVYVQA